MKFSTGCGIVILVLVVLAGGLAYGGYRLYQGMTVEMPIVEHQAQAWIADFNTERFSACYDQADAALTGGVTTEEFAARMKLLKDRTGALVLGTQRGFNLRSMNGDTTVTCQWDASGNGGKRMVEFVLHKVAGVWKVQGFRVDDHL